MQLCLILIALAMGCASAVQGATNGTLAGRIGLGSAVLVNALVVLAGAVCLWLALPRPASGAATSASPWFLYVGGVYGLSIIAGAAFAFPRLGAGPTTALMVAAQLSTALLLDHLGLPHEKLAVTPMRLLGAALLVLGALLVLWPKISR